MSGRAEEDVPCAGPDCLQRVKPGEHFCKRWCRDQLEQGGHDAQLLSLAEATKRGWSGAADKIVDQLVRALERRRARG